jgi:hypothetical protein
MKSKQQTAKEWIAYGFAFALVQPTTMYVCLKVLDWDFLLSGLLAAAMGVSGGMLVLTALSAKGSDYHST